jgi:putative nucleotidyltransferase with HDIG domain
MGLLLTEPDRGVDAAVQTGLGTKLGTSLMAKVLAGLFAAGATLALLTVALPHSSRASVSALLAIVGIAYLMAGVLFWRAGRMPVALLPVALGWGSTLITAVAYLSGESPSPLVPDTNEHGAFIIAERLRCEVRDEFAGDSVPLTISFGVATYPANGETAAAMLRATEEALHAAKWSGRDRTTLHSPAMRAAPHLDGETGDIAAERLLGVMLDLAEAVDLRFSGSARHSETVGRYAEIMARELGLPEQRTSRVRLAGLLHDIGKVGVPDSILQKRSTLSEAEFAVIKRHPELGAQMLDHPSLADVRDWVGAHHERPDGRGYPLALHGAEIPLEARILAVADAYEAMTSDRSYRSSMPSTVARDELERCAGAQFDPVVVQALLAVLEREPARAEYELALAHA